MGPGKKRSKETHLEIRALIAETEKLRTVANNLKGGRSKLQSSTRGVRIRLKR